MNVGLKVALRCRQTRTRNPKKSRDLTDASTNFAKMGVDIGDKNAHSAYLSEERYVRSRLILAGGSAFG